MSVLFDLEEKKAFFKVTEDSVLSDIRKATQVVDLSDKDMDQMLKKLADAEFSRWPQVYAEDQYDLWKYGVENKDGDVYSNMILDLPQQEEAWNLFNDLFSYSVPFPIMKR